LSFFSHSHNQSQDDIYLAPLTMLDSGAEQNKTTKYNKNNIKINGSYSLTRSNTYSDAQCRYASI